MTKRIKPKIKADEFIEYNEGEFADWTHFEELKKKVEVLQEMVDLHADILNQNNLKRIEETEALNFDDDEMYKKLEEDDGSHC